LNQDLERANQVADYLELSELVCRDALMRRESCGGHFRTESVTEDGEAKRDDAQFAFVAAWEFRGEDREPMLHKEPLEYEEARMSTRSYR
jgi:succinate dehydrogenase / fumarate reductase flavoprotein subunit